MPVVENQTQTLKMLSKPTTKRNSNRVGAENGKWQTKKGPGTKVVTEETYKHMKPSASSVK